MSDRESGREHISVCICTYKRPILLDKLLHKLENQKTDDLFTYSVVVVDNDVSKTARAVVDAFSARATVSVVYDVEPERGFCLVRNRAVENARGAHIAFIDDDEYPDVEWLYRLYKALKEYKADGVLGPIIPHYDTEPPKWLIRGRLCERESFKTGTVIQNHVYTRTGNVLLDRSLFVDNQITFDPRFGKTGGEDSDFFKRMMDRGKVFVWCDDAPVWELVPRERMEKAYFLKRALMRGFNNSKKAPGLSMTTLKSLVAVVLYTAALPFCLLMGQHVFMKYLIRNCDHMGKLLGILGMAPTEQRSF